MCNNNNNINNNTDQLYLQEVEFNSSFAFILSYSEELHQIMVADVRSQRISVLIHYPLTVQLINKTLLLFLEHILKIIILTVQHLRGSLVLIRMGYLHLPTSKKKSVLKIEHI